MLVSAEPDPGVVQKMGGAKGWRAACWSKRKMVGNAGADPATANHHDERSWRRMTR
jgi:hypothetical protein